MHLNLAVDIPSEVIFQIASYLTAQDVLNLATTCKKQSSLLNSDAVWESKILEWISEQDVRSGILGSSALKMRELMGFESLRATYQALVLLKFWPCGLWCLQSSSLCPALPPKGLLLWITHHKGAFRTEPGPADHGCHFRFSFVRPYTEQTSAQLPWLPKRQVWKLREAMWTLEIHPNKGVFCFETAIQHLVEFNNKPMQLKFNKQGKSEFQIEYQRSPASSLRSYDVWALKYAEVMPSGQQQQGVPPPGLYYAIYGSHGLEILQLDRIEGTTQYRALKLTGDPNVPANQISFRFDCNPDNCRPGPYDSHRDDPFPTATGPRPILCFEIDGIIPNMEVQLERRPVCTVISNAQGQINRNPRVWQPEWIQATIVMYDYGLDVGSSVENSARSVENRLDESERAVFSVIFEDEGEDYRHVMDFHRSSLPLIE